MANNCGINTKQMAEILSTMGISPNRPKVSNLNINRWFVRFPVKEHFSELSDLILSLQYCDITDGVSCYKPKLFIIRTLKQEGSNEI